MDTLYDDLYSQASKIIEKLFHEAEANDFLQYIYTLVRVTGITHEVDPLSIIRSCLENISDTSEFSLGVYQRLATIEDPLELLYNILNCSMKESYDSLPFMHLRKGAFPNYIHPSPSEMAHEVSKAADQKELPLLAELIRDAYPSELCNNVLDDVDSSNSTSESLAKRSIRALLSSLLDVHNSRIHYFINKPTLYKLPRFAVLELLQQFPLGLNHKESGPASLIFPNLLDIQERPHYAKVP